MSIHLFKHNQADGFFLCCYRTICSFYYIILLFITQVKYPAAIVHVMISKISLI